MAILYVDIVVPFPRDPDRRTDPVDFRAFFAQTPLAPWVATQAESRQGQLPTDYRVQYDPWGDFRPFWHTPPVGSPYFVGYQAYRNWDYWQQDEAKRHDAWDDFRPFWQIPQATNFVFWHVKRPFPWPSYQVRYDPWGDFRPFVKPPVTTPFFVYYQAYRNWDYWTQDEARGREQYQLGKLYPQTKLQPWQTGPNQQQLGPIDYRVQYDPWGDFRPFWQPPTQTPLAPWVATQAENRQQIGPIDFRDVSPDVWSDFRPFWVPPPTPPPPTGIKSGGVYPGNEWTGRREKKKDAALQDTEIVSATEFARKYLQAKKRYQDAEDDELYRMMLHFMIQMDDEEDN